MGFKSLSQRQAGIVAALGSGLIPAGGPHFALGARDIRDKWLPRVDYVISRMPFFTRFGLKLMLHLLEYGWPLLFMKRAVSVRNLNDQELEFLLEKAEGAGVPGAAFMAVIKVLVFPAFYGVKEVREAIGYQSKFPVSSEFVGTKA
ncbi:MAG: hypothetical protein R6U29_00140 [Desulfosudaceae bacterium]